MADALSVVVLILVLFSYILSNLATGADIGKSWG